MEFNKNAIFFVTDDGIPISLGAGEGIPFCAAWDEKEPREYSLPKSDTFYPATYEAFEEARKLCQAAS